MVSEHALPSSAKSAERIEGAMIAGGDMVVGWRFRGWGGGYGYGVGV